MATLSLLSIVIKLQGQRYCPSGIVYDWIQVTKVGPFTRTIVFGIGDGLWFPN